MILALVLLTFVLQVLSQSSDTLQLTGKLYDFANYDSGLPQAHPDFNRYLCGLTTGLVEDTLGPDGIPVLKDGKGCITSDSSFYEWFRFKDGVNYEFDYTVTATWDADQNSYSYSNPSFFPLDGRGYGDEGKGHNFGFCFSLHNQFTYQGGEVFDFAGDDDVWVFIGGKLALDLGGVHSTETGTILLDSLQLTVGNPYNFDLFFCERHVVGSDIAFSTDVELNPCGTVDSDGDGVFDLCDNCPFGPLNIALTQDSINGFTVTIDIALGTTVRDPIDVEFDFGDGNQITYNLNVDSQITYTYAKQGAYTVTASASDPDCGGADTDTLDIQIGFRSAPSCVNKVITP